MNSDRIAFWGLVISAVSLPLTFLGAVAAVVAAYYAKGGATQKSLEVVERNTANTAEQITAVKGHIAQVEGHLNIQNNRESLDIAARATSISVAGEGWNDEPQNLVFTVRTPGVVISSVDLVNQAELQSGSIPCNQIKPGVFEATIEPDAFGKWLNSAELLYQNNRVIYVRARLVIDGASRSRIFPVTTVLQMRAKPNCLTMYYITSGEC